MVVAPLLHVCSGETLERLDAYVGGGGNLVVGYQSAILDPDLHAWLGGYLGPLQRALGVRVEEFVPLVGEDRTVANGRTRLAGEFAGGAARWQDVVRVDDAEVLASFADGFAAGSAAITRRGRGEGHAWYVATLPDEELLDRLVARWVTEAGLRPLLTAPTRGVEAVQRGDTLTVINHTADVRTVPTIAAVVTLAPFDVRLERLPTAEPSPTANRATRPNGGLERP